MTMVDVDGLVVFDPVDIFVRPAARDAEPAAIYRALQIAWQYMDDELLRDAYHGGRGPLNRYRTISLDEFLRIKQETEIQQATRRAKHEHATRRRQQFNRERDQQVLSMIEAGIPYVCSEPGCLQTEDLTLDHVVPLSRGGSDDQSNLRFMCASHNSAKGDRHTL